MTVLHLIFGIIALNTVNAAYFKQVYNNDWLEPTQRIFVNLVTSANPTNTSKSVVCTANPDTNKVYQGESDLTKQFSDCYSKAKGATVVFHVNAGEALDQFTIAQASNFIIIFNGVVSFPSNTAKRPGNMLYISRSSKFIVRSAHNTNSSAPYYGLQGRGYPCFRNGTNGCGMVLIRAVNCETFSINNLGLYDAGKFHLVLESSRNAEIFNIRIWGQQTGGTDGIDVSGQNVYIHDVMVTNGDECVTTKSPAFNFLIEKILCSYSGGSAMGSLQMNTNISNIHYRYIHSESSTQGFMFKSFNSNGTVSNIILENFVLQNMPAYSFHVDSHWGHDDQSTGIQFKNINVGNWVGIGNYNKNARHPTFRADCPPGQKCDLTVVNYQVKDATNNEVTYDCSNVLNPSTNNCPEFRNSSEFPKLKILPDSVVKGPWVNLKAGEPIEFFPAALPYSYFGGMNSTYKALSWGWNII